jgi:hypothetical protein
MGAEASHELLEPGLRVQADEQLHMIRHQRIGVDRAPMALRCFLQAIEKDKVVLVAEETRRAIAPAVDEVVRRLREVGYAPVTHSAPPGLGTTSVDLLRLV